MGIGISQPELELLLACSWCRSAQHIYMAAMWLADWLFLCFLPTYPHTDQHRVSTQVCLLATS